MYATTQVKPTTLPTELRFSLFKLSVKDHKIVCDSGDFDLIQYSRFKYGDGEATRVLAKRLADKIIEQLGERTRELFMAASPYKHVPSAAQNLLYETIAALVESGYAPKGIFKIDRGVVKAVDYSTLSAEQRRLSNAGRQVTVPQTAELQINGENVLIIDDIRVSGTTESETRKALSKTKAQSIQYGYISEIIQGPDNVNAEIEHAITHAAIKTLDDLKDLIITNQDHYLNARTCKFILRSKPEEVGEFARLIPRSSYKQLMYAILADEYHTMPEHSNAFAALTKYKPEVQNA